MKRSATASVSHLVLIAVLLLVAILLPRAVTSSLPSSTTTTTTTTTLRRTNETTRKQKRLRSACRLFVWDGMSSTRYHVCKRLLRDNVYEGLGGKKVSTYVCTYFLQQRWWWWWWWSIPALSRFARCMRAYAHTLHTLRLYGSARREFSPILQDVFPSPRGVLVLVMVMVMVMVMVLMMTMTMTMKMKMMMGGSLYA